MKTCTKCEKEKPLDDFSKAAWGKDGRNSRCRSCASSHFKWWRAANLEHEKARWADWYAANSESQIEKAKLYAAANPERRAEMQREWRKVNPEYMRCANNKRRAQIRNCETPLTSVEWAEILDDFKGLCFWCGAPWEHQDHLVPLSKGGAHSKENVVPACEPCNLRKHNKDPLEFLLELEDA